MLRVGVGSDREVVRGKTADSEFSFYVVPATNSPRGCDSGLETAVRQVGLNSRKMTLLSVPKQILFSLN